MQASGAGALGGEERSRNIQCVGRRDRDYIEMVGEVVAL